MKPGFLLCAVIMCLSAANAVAQEIASTETTQYQLELSKTLTLHPAGTPPQVSPPPDSPVHWPVLLISLLVAAGLLGSRWAYQRGRNYAREVSPVAVRFAKHDDEVAALKAALMESGSGHRREWDSTLVTFKNDVAAKNRRIDELIDEIAARDQQSATRAQELRDVEDGAAAARAVHERELHELRDSYDALQQQFNDVSTHLQTAQSELERTAALNVEKSQQITQLESRLAAQAQEFEASFRELDEQNQQTQSLYQDSATELAAAQQRLEDRQQTIAQLESSLTEQTREYEASAQGLNEKYLQTQSLYKDSAAELATAQQRLEEQQQTIEQLESSLAEVSQEFEGSAAQWENQQSQAQSLLQTAELNASSSAAQIQDQQTTIDRLEASLAGVQQEMDEATAAWKEQDEKVQALLHEADTSASGSAAQIQDQQATIDRLEASLAELGLEFEKAANTWQDTENQTQSLLQTAEAKAAGSVGRIEAQQQTIAQLESSLAELHREYAKATAEWEEKQNQTQSQLLAAEADVSSGTTQLRDQQQTIEQLEYDLAALTRQFDAATAELEEKSSRAETQMQTAETELSSARRKISAQEQMIAQLESSRTDLSREFEASKSQVRSLTEQYDQQAAARETTAADLGSAMQRVQDQQLIIAELESSLAESTRSLQAATASLQEKQDHTQQLEQERQTEIRISAERIDTQQQSIEQLENELAAVRQQLAEKDGAVAQQSQEFESLKDKYAALDATLTARQEEHLVTVGQYETDLQSARAGLGNVGELRDKLAAVEAQNTELVAKLNSSTETHRQTSAAREESLTRAEQAAQQLTQKLDATSAEKISLEKQVEALTRELDSSKTAPEDQRQHAQTQQQLDTAMAHNARLESQLETLQNQYSTLQSEFDDTGRKLRERSTSSHNDEERIAQLVEENRRLMARVRALDEHESAFTETITDLESRLDQSEQLQLHSARQLSDTAQKAQQELQQRATKLELTCAERDALHNKLERLQARLSKAEEHMHEKDMKTLRVSSELVEYKTRQEQYLQDIAALEAQLHDQQSSDNTPQISSEVSELQDALRARDNILNALEQQLNASEATIERLKGDVEHMELAALAHEHDFPVDADEDVDQTTSNESNDLQEQLVKKIHHITRLEAELKVSNDLVRVFENDSNQLQKTEIELEALQESNAFLQNELATTVSEVASLKAALAKPSSYAERQQSLGRAPATTPANQELLLRLASVEAKNKEQSALIESLRISGRETSED